MNVNSRYPGSRSFRDSDVDRRLFYGRGHEKGALLHLVLAENLILFYAKSGTGKTSLLNAGILKSLRDRSYLPIMLRLNGPNGVSAAAIREQVADVAARGDVEVERLDGEPETLAQVFAGLRFWRGDVLLTPILIFDQFEELFTITPHRQRDTFIEEFTELARGQRDREEQVAADRSVSGPAPKIILSLREDYLGELESLAAAVPRVMSHRFRLTALTRAQAEEAIVSPAASKDASIPGSRFSFAPDAVKAMLDFLCAQREGRAVPRVEVEPFQLQILCQHVEEQVRERSAGSPDADAVVRAEDLGGRDGMEAILQGFYSKRVNEFEEKDRVGIRLLCERGLISESEKRLSLEEEEIERQFGVGRALLVQLIEQRLLRADPRTGSTYYELSHDTLVVPILRDRDERDPDLLVRKADAERLRGDNTAAIALYERAVTLQPESVLASVQWASLLAQLGRLDEAGAVLANVIRRGVRHESLHHQLGRVFAAKGNQKAAIEQYGEALKLNDGMAIAHLDLATAYREDKQPDNAVRSYERSIELDGKNAETRRGLALLLVSLRQFDRAVEVFREAVSVSPQFGYLFRDLAKELLANNRKDLARTVCITASGLDSDDGAFYRELGNQFMTLGELELSLPAFEASAKLAPADPWTHLGAALALQALGRDDEASEKLAAAMKLDPVNVLSTVAEWMVDTEPARAVSLYGQAAELAPTDSATLYNWGRALFKSERMEEAEVAYRRALAINASHAPALNGLALITQLRGQVPEAERLFKQAIECEPGDPLYHRNLGDLLRAYTDRVDEATAAYRRAIDLNPESDGAFNGLAMLYEARGQTAEAEDFYRRAMDVAPTKALYPRRLGSLLREAGRPDEAEAAYRQALKIDAKYGDALNGLAILEKARDHPAQAEMWLRRAMEAEPSTALFPRNLGDLLREKTKRWDDAESAYKKALEIDPDYDAALNGLALLEQARRHKAEAEGLFRRAMAVSPREPMYPVNLGALLREANRWSEAEEAFSTALALNPNYGPALHGLALTASARGEVAEAERLLRKAMEVDATESAYLCSLGDLLRERTDRWDEAEASYTKALDITAQAVSAINGLGLLARARGDVDKAERLFRTALTLAPEEWILANNLIDLLNNVKRTEDAESLLRKFVSDNPTSADAHNSLAWSLRNQTELLHEAWTLANRAAELDASPEILHTLADVSVSVDHPQWMNSVSTWLTACSPAFVTSFRADTISTLRKAIQRGRASELISAMRRPPADAVWASWAQALEALMDPSRVGALSEDARNVYKELGS